MTSSTPEPRDVDGTCDACHGHGLSHEPYICQQCLGLSKPSGPREGVEDPPISTGEPEP